MTSQTSQTTRGTHTDQPARVAVVSGGSSGIGGIGGFGGIGAASAERLAADGTAVVVHRSGNEARAEEVVSAITDAGGTASSSRADVADESEVAAMCDRAEREHGGVDVVVNTAGVMVLAPVAEMDLPDLDRQLRTDVRGTFVVSQAAARRPRGGGALINSSTPVTRLAQPTCAATKGATEAMTLIAGPDGRWTNGQVLFDSGGAA